MVGLSAHAGTPSRRPPAQHPYVLKPGQLYLGHTVEQVISDVFVPVLFGRSSVGRPWPTGSLERTNAWIHGFRRLRIRGDIRDDIHEAFLKLACRLIIYRRVRTLC